MFLLVSLLLLIAALAAVTTLTVTFTACNDDASLVQTILTPSLPNSPPPLSPFQFRAYVPPLSHAVVAPYPDAPCHCAGALRLHDASRLCQLYPVDGGYPRRDARVGSDRCDDYGHL